MEEKTEMLVNFSKGHKILLFSNQRAVDGFETLNK